MTGSATTWMPAERISSGVPGLDTILDGGFLRGNTYLINGLPGTGKTVLANQLCYRHIASGGRVLYVTLLTETHARMFSHLQALSFFKHEVVGDALTYISGYATLQNEGYKSLVQQLRHMLIERKVTMLVIDGLAAAGHLVESEVELRHFIHDLQAHAEVTGCTVLLLSPREPGGYALEDTLADGLVRLSLRTLDNSRTVREIEVVKLRGSSFLPGPHSMDLSPEGVVVHPRTETVITRPSPPPPLAAPRLEFDVARLDEMLQGGVLPYSTTMALGAQGSGKTLLGLHFAAAGARRGQHSLYFGFSEAPETIAAVGDQVGLGLTDLMRQGTLELVWQSPLASDVDAIAERILAAVRRSSVQRLCLDGLDGLRHASARPERLAPFFMALIYGLSSEGVTTYVTLDVPELFGPAVQLPIQGTGEVVDTLLFLRHVELHSQLYRLLSVLKMRGSGYDRSIREFAITPRGIELAATFESAEAILTGIARHVDPNAFQRPLGSASESATPP